jgi:hypothetical protein
MARIFESAWMGTATLMKVSFRKMNQLLAFTPPGRKRQQMREVKAKEMCKANLLSAATPCEIDPHRSQSATRNSSTQ